MTSHAQSFAPSPGSEAYELPVSGTLRLARWTTLIAGLAAFTSAIVGIRLGQAWLYQSEDLMLGQIYGLDLLVLFVVLPLLVLSVRAAWRGSVRGLFGWGGVLVFLAYWYHFLLGGTTFGPAYLLHLTVVGSSLLSLGVLGARLDVERIAHRFRGRMPVRSLAALMLTGAGLFVIAGAWDMSDQLRERALLDSATRAAYSVDFTIMLPATILAGILLWRRDSWGYVLAGPLLINAALSAMTLMVAMIALIREGVPVHVGAGAFAIASAVMSGAVIAYLRAMQRPRTTEQADDRRASLPSAGPPFRL
jgi:hypothetical protein